MTVAASHQRQILLAVTGLSPQIVTETVFALALQRRPPFIPTEIHLVTTQEGAERAQLTLIGEEGALPALAAEWNLPELATALDRSRIHIVRDATGQPLADILSPEDNAHAADAITERIRLLTADPAAVLHVSLAGGRKTMGFFAGYALSLFGREHDELSHVLVPPELEQHPQFFFPPRRPRVLYARDTRPVRAEPSAIRLAAIPVVRLRHGLPQALLDGTTSYAAAVAGAAEALGPPHLVVDLAQRRCVAGGITVAMPPIQLAFCAWLIDTAGPDGLTWRDADPGSFLRLYARVVDPGTLTLKKMQTLFAAGVSKEWFDERKARHNKLVDTALGLRSAPYRILAIGRRPLTRFRLALPSDMIELR